MKSRASRPRSSIAPSSAILRTPSLLLLQLLDSLLQGLHHAPEDHVELLVVERHQLPAVQVLRLADPLAQRGGLHLLGDEAYLVLAPLDPIVHAGLHGIEGLLELLLREVPDVRLEGLVREVHEAVAEDQLPVVGAADVRLDRQVGEAVGGVEAHELEESVHLHAAAGERLELHQPVLRVAVEDQRRVSRGRGVACHYAHGTVGHHGDLLQQGAQHLHAAAAPRQAQEGQARFRSYRPVHPQGVVHQHALGPAGDGQHAGRRIAAQQRRLHPQVALDLLRGGDGAAAREGPGGRRGAHEELGEVRRGGVERPVRPDGDVLLQPDAAGGEAGQQRAVFGAKGRGGVPDLQFRRGALQQGRLDEGRGRERVDGEVRRGGHARGVLQGGDPAVDGRDRASERVEGGHQGVARRSGPCSSNPPRSR